MPRPLPTVVLMALIATSAVNAGPIGTPFTSTDASHGDDIGSPDNTIANFVPAASGTLRRIDYVSTLTSQIPGTFAREARLFITSAQTEAGLGYALPFTGAGAFTTLTFSGSIYFLRPIPASTNITVEYIDIFDDGPGADSTNTITYSFDDSYGPNAVEFGGNLTAVSPTYNRVAFDGTNFVLPTFASNVPFDVQPFFVDTDGFYTILNAASFDSYLNLYQGSFDPSDPLTGIAADADEVSFFGVDIIRSNDFGPAPLAEQSLGSFHTDVFLTAGTQYFYVTTAFGNGSALNDGAYINVIHGPGVITLGVIPEPQTYALWGLGAAVVILSLRRRSRQSPALA